MCVLFWLRCLKKLESKTSVQQFWSSPRVISAHLKSPYVPQWYPNIWRVRLSFSFIKQSHPVSITHKNAVISQLHQFGLATKDERDLEGSQWATIHEANIHFHLSLQSLNIHREGRGKEVTFSADKSEWKSLSLLSSLFHSPWCVVISS